MSCQLRRLTAFGRGAVAVIEVCTSDPDRRIDQHFQAANRLQPSSAPINRILYGSWHEEDVVVVRTASETWEIHCHGGEAAVARIAEAIGCQLTTLETRSPRESLLKLLQKCRTPRTADYILSQRQILPAWKTEYQLANDAGKAALVQDMAQWQTFADHLTEPWQIAIFGKPNAGKSSLLNAMVGFDRAIVYDQPGTTRDRVAAEMILDGWPVNLIDTAGIRMTDDRVEKIGVQQAVEAAQTCQAGLYIKDASEPWTEEDDLLLDKVPNETSFAMIYNKSDLKRNCFPEHQFATTFNTIATSGQGIDEILKWIPDALMPRIPSPETPLPLIEVERLLNSDFS